MLVGVLVDLVLDEVDQGFETVNGGEHEFA
jgi:hypothetical protein